MKSSGLQRVLQLAALALAMSEAVAASAAADPSLLFVSDFDAYSVNAALAKGGGEARRFGEDSLQLRMWPGPYGNVNALVYSKGETCAYPLKGNFDPRQGTVSFWVASLGWKPSGKSHQWFVTARQPGFTLHVYKYVWPGYLFFYIETPGPDGKPRRFVASTHVDDQDWSPGRWHKIDATWDSVGMKLYVDGVMPKDYRPAKSAPACPLLKFPGRVDFPEASGKGEIVINSLPTKSGAEKDERTAIDDLRVYARPLSAKEIGDAYAAVAPSAFGSRRERPLLGVPSLAKAVALDGAVGEDEWSDASRAPIAEIAPFSKEKGTSLRGEVRVKRDAKALYLALSSNFSPRLRAVTSRDGKMWEDDSFEVVLADASDAQYHFIVNANGAIYDERRGMASWNSSARCAAKAFPGGWSAELVIPLSDIGGLPRKGNFGLSSHPAGMQKELLGVSWSYVPYSYGDVSAMGDLAEAASPVSLLSCGAPESGAVDLKVSGRAKFSAFVERENGDRIASSVAFPDETWRYAAEPGRQRLFVEAMLPDGSPALRWEHYYYVDREIELSYDCHSRDGYVEAVATLAGSCARKTASPDGLAGEVRIARKSDGAVMSKAAVVARGAQIVARIPLPRLAAGEYFVEASFAGQESRVRFNVPDLTPLETRVGSGHTVPSPWRPVEKGKGNAWRVLDREYVFGGGPFPSSVSSRGKAMFRRAPEVVLDGEPVRWSGFRVTESFPDVVRFAGEGSRGAFLFRWTGELWFDGLYVLKVTTEGTGRISSFGIGYSVPREHSRYVFRQGYREGLFKWKGDRIAKTFDPLRHPDSSLHWTSGVECGVAFGCVSDANWANKPGEENIVYARSADEVSFAAKVISRDVEVSRPLSWTFVLQATPSRRPDANWRAVNMGGYGVPTMQNRQFGGGGDATFADQRKPDRWTTPSNFRPKWKEWFLSKYGGKAKTPKKTKSCLPFFGQVYCMPMHVGTNEAEYDYFFHDAVTRPALTWSYKDDGVTQTEYCTCDTRLYDIWLSNIDWFFRNTPPNIGIYNDCAHAKACDNARHGHGGTDAFGRASSSVCWLEQRDYFLRELRLVRKYRRTVRNHVPGADFVPFVMDFCDEVWPGEEFHASVLENLECYTEKISPEEWQSVFNATIRGVPNHMLTQFGRAASAMDEKKRAEYAFTKRPEWAERILAAALVHDVAVSAAYVDPRTVDKWWVIKEELRLWDAEFHGYWFDDTFKSGTKGMYVSWYSLPQGAPYSRLVVASNFTRSDAPLGLAAAKLGSSAVRELWSGRDMAAEVAANMTVPAKKFVLLGVKTGD